MQNTFVSLLDHAGTVIKDIFTTVLPEAEAAAQAVEPIVDLAFPGLAPLFSSTVTMVGLAQATGLAAAATASTGLAKLAAVEASIQPIAEAYLAKYGITVSDAQVTEWVNGVVALAKVFEAPANSPAQPAKA